MAIWVGTSGWNYPEWKGSFYPEKMKPAEMLPYYAARFPTVEVNNTFYRMPNEKALQGWTGATPERFALTLKAPQRITHFRRDSELRGHDRVLPQDGGDARSEARIDFVSAAAEFSKQPGTLDAFLETLPAGRARRSSFAIPAGSPTLCTRG